MQIKVDHREQDPEQSLSSFEQPKPGVYQAEIDDATVRFHEKGSSKKPRDIELVIKIIDDDDYAGARLWDYPSFSKAAQWKMDQVLLAAGVLSRKKRTYTFKSEKDVKKKLKGKRVTIRVRADSYEGEYRARIAQYMKPRDEDEDEEEFDEEEFEDEELEEEDDEELVDEDEDLDDEDEDEEDFDEEEWTLEEVKAMKIAQLRELADDLDIDHSGLKKAEIRELIVEELELDEEDEAPF